MEQTKKRTAIRQKVKRLMLFITLSSLFVASLVGLIGMMHIRAQSTKALLTQTEQNLMTTVTKRAEKAELERITDFASMFADFAHTFYTNPGHYRPHPVNPPQPENAGKYAIQRCIASTDYRLQDFQDEMNLLGNLEEIYEPVIRLTGDMEMNIYAGTESGFLIGYDRDSCYDSDEVTEDYYYYFDADWYKAAKESKSSLFTDVYSDSIGRGLMISCAAPFYNEKNDFAGAFCLDIHIDKLYETIVDLFMTPDSYAFVIDKAGNAITADRTMNVYENKTIDAAIRTDFKERKTGVQLARNGIYYAYAPIAATDWELCICIPQKTVMAPIYDMNRHILYVILIFMALLCVVLLLVLIETRAFSASLTHPLEELTKDVQEISRGNLDQRARVFDNDEIGDVAISINSMADSLKKHIESLTSVTKEKEKLSNDLNAANQVQQFYSKVIDQLS